MNIIITPNYDALSKEAAELVISRINAFAPTEDRPFVLGLPTGGTPVGMYERLVAACKAGQLSFRHVVTFNMDEYVGLEPSHPESYHYFMHSNLFDHVDIPPQNIHILDGTNPDAAAECQRYEETISRFAPIHLFIAGIGANGHIAFNEPGTPLDSTTHVVDLKPQTIADNSRFFDNDTEKVPHHAMTVGIKTILSAQEILLLASGQNKAQAILHAAQAPVSSQWPASSLQQHGNATIIADSAAAALLDASAPRN